MQCIGADLFVGFTDTATSFLGFLYLFAAAYPDIQAKMHAEIDEVIGADTILQYDDKLKLPYTEAFINEVSRFEPVAPMGLPRRTLQSSTLRGYTIPADTGVLACFYRMNHDPEYWDEPHVFNPDRFLDESGKFQRRNCLMPFSAGIRIPYLVLKVIFRGKLRSK